MNVAEIRLCLLLHSISSLDDSILTRLLLHCGSPQGVAEAGPKLWRELGMSASVSHALLRALDNGKSGNTVDTNVQLSVLTSVGADVLAVSDARYPPLLRTIHDPPPLLYVRGNPALLAQAQLAVVGSRRASPAGERAAADLAGQASQAGLQITSGLALGIDGAAHRGALAAGGCSIGVMATGVDILYPARHRALALELEHNGCLVSEFPPGVPPLPFNFPRRNRIISGLSLGVLVVEAALPSGSLITARTAMEQGREVFALPWSIYHAGGNGCLHLLRDGAKMVQSIQHVLEELGSLYALQQDLFPDRETSQARAQAEIPQLSECQQQVLQLVGYEAVTLDELVQASSLPVAQLTAELSWLELQEQIARCAGGYIRK